MRMNPSTSKVNGNWCGKTKGYQETHTTHETVRSRVGMNLFLNYNDYYSCAQILTRDSRRERVYMVWNGYTHDFTHLRPLSMKTNSFYGWDNFARKSLESSETERKNNMCKGYRIWREKGSTGRVDWWTIHTRRRRQFKCHESEWKRRGLDEQVMRI